MCYRLHAYCEFKTVLLPCGNASEYVYLTFLWKMSPKLECRAFLESRTTDNNFSKRELKKKKKGQRDSTVVGHLQD